MTEKCPVCGSECKLSMSPDHITEGDVKELHRIAIEQREEISLLKTARAELEAIEKLRLEEIERLKEDIWNLKELYKEQTLERQEQDKQIERLKREYEKLARRKPACVDCDLPHDTIGLKPDYETFDLKTDRTESEEGE